MTQPAVPIPDVADNGPRSAPSGPRLVAVPDLPPEDGSAARPMGDHDQDGMTLFRCGGCGTTARFAHDDQQYGRLVHRFLDRHEQCGDAMEITPL